MVHLAGWGDGKIIEEVPLEPARDLGSKTDEHQSGETNLLPLVVERRDSDVSHKVTGSLHPTFLHMRHNHAQFINHTVLPRERSTGLSVSHALSPSHLGLLSQRLGPPLPGRWSECEEPSYLPELLPLSAAVSRTLSHSLPPPETEK